MPDVAVCLSEYTTQAAAGAAQRRFAQDVYAYEHPKYPPSSVPQAVQPVDLPGGVAYYLNFATVAIETVSVNRGRMIAQVGVTCGPPEPAATNSCDLAVTFAQQQLRLLAS